MADSRSHPQPDYGYWLKQREEQFGLHSDDDDDTVRWLLKDAIFLLLDIDPKCEMAQGAWLVVEARGKKELGCFADTHPLKSIIQKAFEYNRLALTHYQENKLRVDGMQGGAPSVEPEHWLCWARSERIPLPPPLADFLKEVDQRSEAFQVALPTAFDVPAGSCKRESLLKMALGMAMAAYDYKPGALKHRATGTKRGSISADLQRLGLTLDAATVRKILAEAETRFPDIIKTPSKPV